MATEMLGVPLQRAVSQVHAPERRKDKVWRQETPCLARVRGAGPRGQAGKFVFKAFR